MRVSTATDPMAKDIDKVVESMKDVGFNPEIVPITTDADSHFVGNEVSNMYDGEQIPIVVYIPKDTVKIDMVCKVVTEEDKLVDMLQRLGVAEVEEAKRDGAKWDDEYSGNYWSVLQ